MKKLTAADVTRHADLGTALHAAHEALGAAVAKYNDTVAQAHAALQPLVDAFNEKIDEANAFVEEIHDEQQTYFDDKSETWQEGDAGSAYSDWMGQWELSLEEISLEEPIDIETPETDIESFDGLDTERL